MMNFFRRPQLAGNNIVRPLLTYVRGSLRRADADGFSAVPYFPAVAATNTLSIKIDGSTYNVVLTGNGLATVLSDINAVLGVNGVALDADGSILIQSYTLDATASVEVTGGTAATGLGFDLSLGTLRSVGGDIGSSPEGRIGNKFGTAFPNRGENLTTESVNRALARISSNVDVLFSSQVRSDALPKKTAYSTSDGKTLTFAAPETVRLFSGLGLLSDTSSKEDLAPFFFLVDQATGLPPASRVVGIVRGSPAGLPPYANATTWTGGGATGNILGLDLTKATATIDDIQDGRVLNVSGADFVTSKVVPGDFASISSATNLTPWSNNGYRWVVEEVISSTSIALRPMSLSELQLVGTAPTDEQPIVDLNTNIGFGEIFGSVSIKTGTFTNDAKVIVDPPIPAGATYDLYVSVPGDIRSKKPHESQAKDVSNRAFASDLRPSPNVLLSAPTVISWTAASVVLSTGLARFSGRVVSIPAKTIPAASFSTTNPNYVYWDKDANDIKVTTSHVLVLNSDPAQAPGSTYPLDTPAAHHLVAEVTKTGANIVSVRSEGRAVGDGAATRVITVGEDGQFSKFEDAIRFVNRWWKGNGYRTDTYAQFEIVLVSDTTVDFTLLDFGDGVEWPTGGSIYLDCPVRIRGARSDVKLSLTNWASGSPFVFGYIGNGGSFLFENLHILCDSSFSFVTAGLFNGYANTDISLKNVRISSNGSEIRYIAFSNGSSFSIEECSIEDIKQCLFSDGGSGSARYSVLKSKLVVSSNFISTNLFGSVAAGTPFSCGSLIVRDCAFESLGSDQFFASKALIGTFGDGLAVFDSCTFKRTGPNTAGMDTCLFKRVGTGELTISRCESLAPSRVFISSPADKGSFILDCNIQVEPDEAANSGIQASIVRGCRVQSLATNQTIMTVGSICEGNYIKGLSGDIAINAVGYYTVVSNNIIENPAGTGIVTTADDCSLVVTGNDVDATNALHIIASPGKFKTALITGNYLLGSTNGIQIDENAATTYKVNIAENIVSGNVTGAVGGFIGNRFESGSFTSSSQENLRLLLGNRFLSTGAVVLYVNTPSVSDRDVMSVEGNLFGGDFSFATGAVLPTGVLFARILNNAFTTNWSSAPGTASFRDDYLHAVVDGNYFLNRNVSIEHGTFRDNTLRGGNGGNGQLTVVASLNNRSMVASGNTFDSFLYATTIGTGLPAVTGYSLVWDGNVGNGVTIDNDTITGSWTFTNNVHGAVSLTGASSKTNWKNNSFSSFTSTAAQEIDFAGNYVSGNFTHTGSGTASTRHVVHSSHITGSFTTSSGNSWQIDGLVVEGAVLMNGASHISITGSEFRSTFDSNCSEIDLRGSWVSASVAFTSATPLAFLVVGNRFNSTFSVNGGAASGSATLVGNWISSATYVNALWGFVQDCTIGGDLTFAPGVGVATLDGSRIGGNYTHSCTTAGVAESCISNSHISGTFTTSATAATSSLQLTGCNIWGAATITWPRTGISSVFFRSASAFALGGQNVYVSDCEVSGALTSGVTGRLTISSSQVVGALTATTSALDSLHISSSTIAGAVTVGAIKAVEITGVYMLSSFAWSHSTNTGKLAMSSSYVATSFTTTLTPSSSADVISLDGVYVGTDFTAYGNKTLHLSGCSFGYDSGTAIILKSGFDTHVSGCYFGPITTMYGNSIVSGTVEGSRFSRLRIEDTCNNFIINGNTFSGGASGTTLFYPLWVHSATATGRLIISNNEFQSINGIVAGTTVQAPCILLGDISTDVFVNTLIANNICSMTTRTSNAAAANYGVITAVGHLYEATITGNHLIRGDDFNSATNVGVLIVTISSATNTLYDGNHSFATDFAAPPSTITYSGDANAKGAANHYPTGSGMI